MKATGTRPSDNPIFLRWRPSTLSESSPKQVRYGALTRTSFSPVQREESRVHRP